MKLHPVGPGEFKPDLAWPFYPFRQSRADLERTRSNVAASNATLWREPSRAFFHSGIGWWIVFPIPVAVISFLLVLSLASWFCFLLYALINVVYAGVSLALLVPAAAALRAAERWRRGKLITQGACMQCFHVTPWPAYQCPTCLRPHHDVRPGRLGLLVRRCECGTHLPTRASRAAWKVTPLCQRCGSPLPEGGGAVRDVRIPVFGDIWQDPVPVRLAQQPHADRPASRARRQLPGPGVAGSRRSASASSAPGGRRPRPRRTPRSRSPAG